MDERRWRSGSSRGSASTQLVVLAVLVGIIVLVVVTSTTFLSVRGSGSEASPSGQGSVPLTDFTKRCVAAVDDLDVAEVLLDQRPDMRLNEASRVRLTIGPAGFAPIESEGEMSPQGEVRVSCTIDARLRVVSGDAEVEPADWETQQYIPPAPARWVWSVKPLTTGTVEAVVEVRPVVRVADPADPAGAPVTSALGTVSFDVVISVEQTLLDRIRSFGEAAGSIQGALAAVAGILAILGVWKWGPGLWRRLRGPEAGDDVAKDALNDVPKDVDG